MKSFQDVMQFIGDDGINAENFIRELYLSYIASNRRIGGAIINNMIAFGPGGFGKSTIVKKFLEALGEDDVKVFDANSATSVEKIQGGMNYPRYINEGVTRYNVDDSWMAHKIAIFEEGLSMPIKTITALRNALQSGLFVNGEDEYRIKTEWIIILTNRNPDDFAGDEDMDALLSRFLYRCKVDWSHVPIDEKVRGYKKIIENEGFMALDDQEIDALAQICASNDEASPRLAKLIAGRSDVSKEIFGTMDLQTICTQLGWSYVGIEGLIKAEAMRSLRTILDVQMQNIRTIESHASAAANSKAGNRLELLKMANTLVQKTRQAILDAYSAKRDILVTEPYEVSSILAELRNKETEIGNIASVIALS